MRPPRHRSHSCHRLVLPQTPPRRATVRAPRHSTSVASRRRIGTCTPLVRPEAQRDTVMLARLPLAHTRPMARRNRVVSHCRRVPRRGSLWRSRTLDRMLHHPPTRMRPLPDRQPRVFRRAQIASRMGRRASQDRKRVGHTMRLGGARRTARLKSGDGHWARHSTLGLMCPRF